MTLAYRTLCRGVSDSQITEQWAGVLVTVVLQNSGLGSRSRWVHPQSMTSQHGGEDDSRGKDGLFSARAIKYPYPLPPCETNRLWLLLHARHIGPNGS